VSRTSPQDPGPPELPGYRYLRHIGAGGNAQVYLYEQELPRRKVAVKVLNDSALSAAARRRFTAEANVTAVLAHRHIVQVFDAKVTDDGRPYIVMPFYPQPNLSVRARRAHFSVAQVLRIGIQIGSAVETSHRHDVLHRDIKPQNILTDSYGEPALTDFGIATTRPGDGPEGLSVPWSPPEILDGKDPGDERSDVYSLGATLWHLLVGRPPFEQPDGGNTTSEMMDRISSDPPPATERADVPSTLERLLRQAMAKNPAARPQSAMELIRGLQSVEQELRLPLTHPILPAEEPARADTQGGDTVARPAANPGESAFSRDGDAVIGPPQSDRAQPTGPAEGAAASAEPAADTGHAGAAWSDDTQDLTVVRGDQAAAQEIVAADASPVVAADPGQGAASPPPASTESARGRPAGRLDPWSTASTTQAGGDTAATRVRVPVVLDPSGGTDPIAGDQEAAAGQRKPGRGRVFAFVGGSTLLVAAAVVATLALSRGAGGGSGLTGGGQGGQPGGQSALGPGAVGPGQPTVTASRVNASQVEFRWTYANPASHDTFRLQVSGGTGNPAAIAAKPDLLLTVAKGHSVCITVTVRSADGEASPPSNTFCWPN
jgi:tRNA A-37 threonylcarbamoyl transferase component Bud32